LLRDFDVEVGKESAFSITWPSAKLLHKRFEINQIFCGFKYFYGEVRRESIDTNHFFPSTIYILKRHKIIFTMVRISFSYLSKTKFVVTTAAKTLKYWKNV
jgi:hypothetical protein